MRWIVCFGAVLLVNSALYGQCEQAKLTPSNYLAQLGTDVGLDGDVIVVGAWNDTNPDGIRTGAAWVYRLEDGDWIQQQKLYPANLNETSAFGLGVAIEGNTIVIGDQGDDQFGISSGAVYIFEHDGAHWIETQKLVASDGHGGDFLGISLDLCGDTLLVGAMGDDQNGDSAGAAYIFRHDGESWVEHQKLISSDGEPLEDFGVGVSLDGDVAVIGTPYKHDLTGASYVFRYDPKTDSWVEEQKLMASDAEPGDKFGRPCVAGNTIVVSTARDDNENGIDAGAVYVFNYDGSMWVETQKLLAPDGFPDHQFGQSPTLDGDRLIVGSDDDMHGLRAGATYLYRFNGRQWLPFEKFVASDGEALDEFGSPSDLQGQRMILAARHESDNFGGAYVFEIDDEPFLDCNNNLIDDMCETEFADCDDNGIPDDCDIADGRLDDCNEDGLPDLCGELGTFRSTSPELSPIGQGSPQTHAFTALPVPLGQVKLSFTAVGDFHKVYQELAVRLNGRLIGEIFGGGLGSPPACDTFDGAITLTTTEFSNLVDDGDRAEIRMSAGHSDPFACEVDTYVQVEISYLAVLPITDCNGNGISDDCDRDCNENGVPDECEALIGDLNDDGVVGTTDLLLLLNNWGRCADCDDCYADIDCDCAVGTLDLIILLGNWR